MLDLSVFRDDELQAMAAAGSGTAEEELAVRYSRLVRICARPFFLAGGDREDLMQEGMLGLLSAIRTYDPDAGAEFRSYAELCIRRRLLSAIKLASGRKHMPLNDRLSLDDLLSNESQTQLADIAGTYRRIPEEQVLARESELEFSTTFTRRLSDLEAQTLSRYLAGLSYNEIAAELGHSPKSIDNAVQRIRRKLERYLDSGDDS